jgi:hypothetical protein
MHIYYSLRNTELEEKGPEPHQNFCLEHGSATLIMNVKVPPGEKAPWRGCQSSIYFITYQLLK